MEFSTDVFSLDRPSKVKFDLVGSKLPNNNDVYFTYGVLKAPFNNTLHFSIILPTF